VRLRTCAPRAPASSSGSSPNPSVDATFAAAVQATLQGRAQSTGADTGTPIPSAVLDETFAASPKGWPDDPKSTAWYADASYHLQARVAQQFVAANAPPTDAFHDGTVSTRFHKTGGPPGGGYGLIVDDQGPEVHNGLYQGGQFVVLEVGDDGTIGAWQRVDDHWIDIVPWTPNGVVHPGATPNDLEVRSDGHQLTFVVNDTQVTQVTTDLPSGRIGVFVGGDGNQVVLEHFTAKRTAQSPAAVSNVTPSATAPPTAASTSTPTVRTTLYASRHGND
jgi:hypothetical protein